MKVVRWNQAVEKTAQTWAVFPHEDVNVRWRRQPFSHFAYNGGGHVLCEAFEAVGGERGDVGGFERRGESGDDFVENQVLLSQEEHVVLHLGQIPHAEADDSGTDDHSEDQNGEEYNDGVTFYDWEHGKLFHDGLLAGQFRSTSLFSFPLQKFIRIMMMGQNYKKIALTQGGVGEGYSLASEWMR